MKRTNKMLVLGLCVASMCSMAMAQDKGAKKVKKSRDVVAGEYKIMIKELKMTPQQQASMRTILTAYKKQQADSLKTNGPKMESLKKQHAEAKKANDKATVKKVNRELRTLRKADKTLNDKKKADIAALLTPEQKKQYATYKVYRQTLRAFAKAKLTDEQKAKAKTLAAEHSGNFVGKPKTKRAAQKALNAKVTELLTEEQKAAMKKKPAKKAKAPKAKKGKK